MKIMEIDTKMFTDEGVFQAYCFQLHWNYYPKLRKRLCCVNNNSWNKIQGNHNKAKGVISGASDMFYLLEKGVTLYIEFKLPGKKQSDDQIEWEALCKLLGHLYAIVHTEQEFWDLIGLAKPETRQV